MALLYCILLSFCVSSFGISDRRRCADSKCEVPISYGVAKLQYTASERGKVSLKRGDVLTVYSKEAGNDTSLWGVEVGGKRGYVPKEMVLEEKVLHKYPEHIVSTRTDRPRVTEIPDNNFQEDISIVSSANSPFRRVDGTTIYRNKTSDELETQPIEIVTSNTQESVDVQSSKTNDATSISKSTFDEIDDSMASDVKEYKNTSAKKDSGMDKHVENSQMSREDNVSEEGDESQSGQGEDEADIGGGGDDDDDDDDEDGDGDEFHVETGENFHDGKEEMIGQRQENQEENQYDINNSDLTSRGKSQFTIIPESGSVVSNIQNNIVTDQGAVDANDEPVNNHKKEHRGEDDVLNIDQSLDAKNEIFFLVNSQENDMKDSNYLSETQQKSVVTETENGERKVVAQSIEVYKENVSSEIALEGGASSEFSSNLSKESGNNDGFASSSSTHEDNTADKESIEKKRAESKPYLFASPEKPNDKKDSFQGMFLNDDISISSENQEVSTPVENALVEQVTTVNLGEESSNLYATSTTIIEFTSEPEENTELAHHESTESAVPSQGDEYQGNHTPITEESVAQDDSELSQMKMEISSQGTCEMHLVGCEPGSDNLPEQLSPSEVEEQGWFSSLFGVSSLESYLLVSSSLNKEMHKSSVDRTLLYLMVTAIAVIVFSLGYYYIEKQRRDGILIARINSLEKELMVSAQEVYSLKDELESAKEQLSVYITSIDSGDTSSELKDELEECKNARLELEEQVSSLEKELETATEVGFEVNRMMSELLSAQHGSDKLMKSVDHLQKQLDSQQSTISTMTANLTAKSLENENLQSELNHATEHAQNLEEQLAKALESKSADSQRLCRELDALENVVDETRKTLAARDGEISVLRECLNHAECLSNGGVTDISLEKLLDVGHLRAKIDTITKQRDEFQEKLQGEEDARKLFEDHMKIVSEEVSTLRAKYEEADRGKTEAQTRLEVLSNYFKEKETQLLKELGLQEAMYIQKEGDALSTVEQIKAFQEEIENYKAQNGILKKEILEQERSMKSQIAILEKKVHENWFAARQAERRMEESKQEASQLRNRLTMSGRRLVGTMPVPDIGKPPERGTLELEHNGEMSTSPAHMDETQELPSSPLHFGLPGSPPLLSPGGQPLSPGPFPGLSSFLIPGGPGMPFPMPPPPGALFPEELRPPPLGRISSPPPPEPRGSFSPFEHTPPMSPPSRPYRSLPHYEDSPSRYRHQTPLANTTPSYSGPFSPGKWDDRGETPRSSFRPLHRDSPREPKGSALSSGHSTESLDKGSRHNQV